MHRHISLCTPENHIDTQYIPRHAYHDHICTSMLNTYKYSNNTITPENVYIWIYTITCIHAYMYIDMYNIT